VVAVSGFPKKVPQRKNSQSNVIKLSFQHHFNNYFTINETADINKFYHNSRGSVAIDRVIFACLSNSFFLAI
ncbi:MAG: hypothetical protein WBW79_12175, partial [Desulfocapsaceae bacterium]